LIVLEPGQRAGAQFREGLLEDRHRTGVEIEIERADEVILQIGDQTAKSAQHAGCRRNDDFAHLQFTREEAGHHWTGAPKRQKREVARINAEARKQTAHLREHA
jgi:hypothetical protein